jgi:glycosyltransferase involved in cell wall biosynthesis
LIITPSKSVKSEIVDKFRVSFERVLQITHGNSLPEGITHHSSKPYFLSIGTVEPRKNLDFYSKAITESKLLNDFDFYHVGRIGWGKLPTNLKQKTAKSDQELANLIKNAQAVVIPSIYEGFGLPVLEAHAQGVPVIMSNVESLKELSIQRDQIFELSDLDSLIQLLNYFAKNKITLDEKDVIKATNTNWLTSAQKHVEAYKRLINE